MIGKIIALLIGGLLGFLYYRFIGCHGGWGLTSHWYTAVVYGAVLGVLFSSMK